MLLTIWVLAVLITTSIDGTIPVRGFNSRLWGKSAIFDRTLYTIKSVYTMIKVWYNEFNSITPNPVGLATILFNTNAVYTHCHRGYA